MRPYFNPDSEVLTFLTKLCEDYRTKIKAHLLQYQKVLIQHTIFALRKIEKGETPFFTKYQTNSEFVGRKLGKL